MLEKGHIILIISLLFNVLLLGTGSYVVKNIGGLDFIKAKMQATPSPKTDSAYYSTKKAYLKSRQLVMQIKFSLVTVFPITANSRNTFQVKLC